VVADDVGQTELGVEIEDLSVGGYILNRTELGCLNVATFGAPHVEPISQLDRGNFGSWLIEQILQGRHNGYEARNRVVASREKDVTRGSVAQMDVWDCNDGVIKNWTRKDTLHGSARYPRNSGWPESVALIPKLAREAPQYLVEVGHVSFPFLRRRARLR
jgi:hypothetical protein